MVNLLPAILVGGPPHAGKSVLTYNLTQALRKRNVDHYVLRACPDGEGDWSQEIDQRMVSRIRLKGNWTPEFVKNICRDIERRHFPLLVDVGGYPEEWQMSILSNCTHSLLLLHQQNEHTTAFWHQLAERHGLLSLAELYSELEGTHTIADEVPIIKGTLAGLNRNTLINGSLFDILVERIVTLFTSYSPEELSRGHIESAPGECVDLDAFVQVWEPQTKRWDPGMLIRLLAEVPQDILVAVYGRGTNWLYAAIALHAYAQPFYQFDSRLGWVSPLPVRFGSARIPEIHIKQSKGEDFTLLNVHPINDHIDYDQVKDAEFPFLSLEWGLVLSGKLPLWLVTALVRLYNEAGLPWIACYHPPSNGAVVVISHTNGYTIGDIIPMEI